MRSSMLLVLASFAALTACGPVGTGSGGSGGSANNGGNGGTAGQGGTGGAGPVGGLIAGRVTRYDYAFDADALTADTLLAITVLPPGGDCIDLESRRPPSGEVTWNGAPAASATAEGGVFHACGALIESGALALRAP